MRCSRSAHTDLLIAHAYERLGKPDESARYLNRAKARAPRDPEVLRAVAGQYRDQGQYDQAIAALQAIPTKTIDVQAELAYTYQLAGKPQEAADIYTQAGEERERKSWSEPERGPGTGWTWADGCGAERSWRKRAGIDSQQLSPACIQGAIAEADRPPGERAQNTGWRSAILPPHVPEGPLYPIELRLNFMNSICGRMMKRARSSNSMPRSRRSIR